MSYSLNGESAQKRVDDVRAAQQRRLNRFFVAAGSIEIGLLAIGAFLVFGLELIDPEIGIWVLVAIAAVGGFVISGFLISSTRRNAEEISRITGRG